MHPKPNKHLNNRPVQGLIRHFKNEMIDRIQGAGKKLAAA
jgi:hypothetical protein